MKAKKNICILCNKEYSGYGNNALPIKEGFCCDDCNLNKVILARLFNLKKNICFIGEIE